MAIAESDADSTLRLLRTGGRSDFRSLAKLSAGYLLARVIPRRLDRWGVRRFVKTSIGVRTTWARRIEGRMREAFGARLPDADFRALAVDYCEMVREIQWLRMRAYHTTALPVETSTDGLERIDEALAQGGGVVLWGMSFCEPLPVKLALQRAGLEVVHLSAASHGVPPPYTEFGLRFVGPFHSAAEKPFVHERVVIPADDSLGYMRLLRERLRQNRCIYIRGDIRSVRSNISARLFGQDVEFAPGAPGLSWKHGCPLLPVHIVRDAPFRYRAVIHPPIDVDRDLDKKQFITKSVMRFAEVIERSALESPSSWELSTVLRTHEWDH